MSETSSSRKIWRLKSPGARDLLLIESKRLDKTRMKQSLDDFGAKVKSSNNFDRLRKELQKGQISFSSYAFLLRWSITEGRKFHGEKHKDTVESAQKLWRLLFGDEVPRWRQWDNVKRKYIDDKIAFQKWLASVVGSEGIEPLDDILSMEVFLSKIPPGKIAKVAPLTQYLHSMSGAHLGTAIFTPWIRLHCDDDGCDRIQPFEHVGTPPEISKETAFLRGDWRGAFLIYKCRNCGRSEKLFSFRFRFLKSHGTIKDCGEIQKIGEWPHFRPRIPGRVLRLVQPRAELFKKARRAEAHGLGIGAFAYYRRIVESEKDRLFEKIIEVAERLNAPKRAISELKAAKSSFKFKSSVEDFKHLIPSSLLVDGHHNPLTVLHKALSEGLHPNHNMDDDFCLSLSSDIRTVMTNLAERIQSILRENRELSESVARILSANARKQGPS